ncbi:MAG: hypothetical protein WEC75_03225 [Dehalococcoidia bacterium]
MLTRMWPLALFVVSASFGLAVLAAWGAGAPDQRQLTFEEVIARGQSGELESIEVSGQTIHVQFDDAELERLFREAVRELRTDPSNGLDLRGSTRFVFRAGSEPAGRTPLGAVAALGVGGMALAIAGSMLRRRRGRL